MRAFLIIKKELLEKNLTVQSIYMRIFTLISEPSSLILYVNLVKIYKKYFVIKINILYNTNKESW